jgi:hypothetical protein
VLPLVVHWIVVSLALAVVGCLSLVVVALFENFSEAGSIVWADSEPVEPAFEAVASVVMSSAAAVVAVDSVLPMDSSRHLFHPVPMHPPYP